MPQSWDYPQLGPQKKSVWRESSMRVRRSQDRALQHPGQPEVGGVFPAAGEEPSVLDASHAPADRRRHRDGAAARTAATMFR